VSAKPIISIVVPVLNEEDNVEPLHEALTTVMADLADRYEYEILFTDNHSTDKTFSKLEAIVAADHRVRALRFSKNFGFQKSILTGYLHATGDAVIEIDADMQDPPELIPEFIEKWEQGYHVVYGVRRTRQEGFLSQKARRLFYRLIDALSDDHLPHDAGDFRLVSRQVVDLIREVDDYHPYLRGLIASFGFEQVGIPYDRSARASGESKFSFGQLTSLAVDGILQHSVIPLRIASITGLVLALIMVLVIVGYAIGRIFFGQEWPAGFATTTVLLLLGIVLNALFLGIIGEYLGRIYQQVKKRPITIIEREIGADVATEIRAPDRDVSL
jgi:dolichol-phosphate mannosyltransferase